MQAGDYYTLLSLKLLQNVRIEAEIQFSLLALIDSVTSTLETPTTNQNFCEKETRVQKMTGSGTPGYLKSKTATL